MSFSKEVMTTFANGDALSQMPSGSIMDFTQALKKKNHWAGKCRCCRQDTQCAISQNIAVAKKNNPIQAIFLEVFIWSQVLRHTHSHLRHNRRLFQAWSVVGCKFSGHLCFSVSVERWTDKSPCFPLHPVTLSYLLPGVPPSRNNRLTHTHKPQRCRRFPLL